MNSPKMEYECPVCAEWVAILNTTSHKFNCPWCKEPLLLERDAEFENGAWHDLSRLVTFRSHWDEEIEQQ
jgi:transcription initiation factor IIE alpha subunit